MRIATLSLVATFLISVAAGVLGGAPLAAQTAVSANGVVESTYGGFKFPDGSIQTTAQVAGAALVEDTGQQACWDQDGNSISCAGTGQDGELRAGVDPPTPRFTDNGDGTVTDNLTDLIWLKDANCFGPRSWANALSDANGLMSGSCDLTDGSVATDWRLPNIRELSSLVDYGQWDPALPSGHPFASVQSNLYWSSTSFVGNTPYAWDVHMLSGIDMGVIKPDTSVFVWPVRGGH